MKHKRTMRFFALILSIIMCISLVPGTAYAEGFSISFDPQLTDQTITLSLTGLPSGAKSWVFRLNAPFNNDPFGSEYSYVKGNFVATPTSLEITLPTDKFSNGLFPGMYRASLFAYSEEDYSDFDNLYKPSYLAKSANKDFFFNSSESVNILDSDWEFVSFTKDGTLNKPGVGAITEDYMTIYFNQQISGDGYYTATGTNLDKASSEWREFKSPAFYAVLDENRVLLEWDASGFHTTIATLAYNVDGYDVLTIPLKTPGDNIVFRRPASAPTPPPAPVYYDDPVRKVVVPVFGDENRVKVYAELDGTKATVEDIKDEVINTVIGDEVETGIVHVDLSNLGQTIKKAVLKKTTLDKIADAINDSNNDTTGFEIDLTTAKVRFDAAATLELQEQAKGSTLWLVVDDVKKYTLNEDQKATADTLNVAKIIDAYLVSDGLRLCTAESDGLGYGKARVMLPYKLKEGETPAIYTVYYLDEEGVLQELDAVYNIDEGCFEFDLEHFSNYIIAYTEDKAESFDYMKCPQDTTCCIYPFWDSDPLAWYHDGVHYCIENGLMVGYPDHSFRPLGGITRAEIAMTLWRIEGCPVVNDAPGFEDVSADAWYTDAVRWASAKNVMEGFEDGLFHAEQAASREMLADVLYAYANTKGKHLSASEAQNPALTYIDTEAVSELMKESVFWCTQNGVITGIPDGSFEPQRITRRAEAAAMFQRLRELIVFGNK